MNNQEREWLLQAIAHTSDEEELTCEQCEELLAVYVEEELMGGTPATSYPAVYRHLMVCPGCHATYTILRETLTDAALFDAATAAPAPPAQPATSTADPLRRLLGWATGELETWRNTLSPLGLAFRTSNVGESTLEQLPLPTLPGVSLDLMLIKEQGQATLSGAIQPSQPVLHGRNIYLIAVSQLGSLEPIDVRRTEIDEFDTFSFEELPPATYILILDLPAGAAAVAWLTLS